MLAQINRQIVEGKLNELVSFSVEIASWLHDENISKPLLCCERMTVLLRNPTKPPTTPLSFCLSRDHGTHIYTNSGKDVGRLQGQHAADKNNALADVLTPSPLQPPPTWLALFRVGCPRVPPSFWMVYW